MSVSVSVRCEYEREQHTDSIWTKSIAITTSCPTVACTRSSAVCDTYVSLDCSAGLSHPRPSPISYITSCEPISCTTVVLLYDWCWWDHLFFVRVQYEDHY